MMITFLSLYNNPISNPLELPELEKIFHFFAYFFLALFLGIKKPNQSILFILFYMVFGGLVELVQPYVNRHNEWFDFIVNNIGIISGFFVGVFINNISFRKY